LHSKPIEIGVGAVTLTNEPNLSASPSPRRRDVHISEWGEIPSIDAVAKVAASFGLDSGAKPDLSMAFIGSRKRSLDALASRDAGAAHDL
jgi:hypothetical protein